MRTHIGKDEAARAREHAMRLYMGGAPKELVARETGRAVRTVEKWIAAGGWRARREGAESSRELARALYVRGEDRRSIADKTGADPETVDRWIAAGGWREQRAAAGITRTELVNKLLRAIDRLIDQVNEDDDPEALAGLGDRLSKLAAAIERLDKKTSVVEVIETFMAFSRWMQYRMATDREVTPELLRTINRYHDLYVNERLQGDGA